MLRWCSPAVVLDYQCSGVMGLASQDKRNPDEMNHVGAERAALHWWKKASHSERWDCNTVILTWLTAGTPQHCLVEKGRTAVSHRFQSITMLIMRNYNFRILDLLMLVAWIEMYTLNHTELCDAQCVRSNQRTSRLFNPDHKDVFFLTSN